MRWNILKVVVFTVCVVFHLCAQNYYSAENRIIFGDYLFASGDFLRASEEYKAVLQKQGSIDSIAYRLTLSGYALRDSGLIMSALRLLRTPEYSRLASFPSVKMYLQTGDNTFKEFAEKLNPEFPGRYPRVTALGSFLFGKTLQADERIFAGDTLAVIRRYLEVKNGPDAYSPYAAGLLSTCLPGAGKIYTGAPSEGISTMIITGILVYSAVKNRSSAMITGGFAAWFYLSDIYGSFIGAKVKNRKLRDENEESFRNYLREKNYFIPGDSEGLFPGVKATR